MKQYIDLCKRIIDTGTWVYNERTGKRCKVVINADFEYDCSEGLLPILTTKQAYWVQAIAEKLGYVKGLTNAADFRALGCKTWDNNANVTPAWLANPNRKGKDDMGRVYGAQGRDWKRPDGGSVDQLRDVYEDLRNGIDNRSEIITYLNPGERDLGCLNACMHTHSFSILNETLYLTSYQRSVDVPLGLGFNQIQCAWFLMVMAQITGLKAGTVFHKMINVHIYEDQMEALLPQLEREPLPSPTLIINPAIKTLEDLEGMDVKRDHTLVGYKHHEPIKFAFSV